MQREELLVQLLREQGRVPLDEQQMRLQRAAIMRQVRAVQAERSASWTVRLRERLGAWVAEPKYGLALLFLVLALVQLSGRHAPESEQAVYVNVRGPAVEPIEDEGLDAYPDLPENLRLFPPPTGGDGTVMPAEFEFK